MPKHGAHPPPSSAGQEPASWNPTLGAFATAWDPLLPPGACAPRSSTGQPRRRPGPPARRARRTSWATGRCHVCRAHTANVPLKAPKRSKLGNGDRQPLHPVDAASCPRRSGARARARAARSQPARSRAPARSCAHSPPARPCRPPMGARAHTRQGRMKRKRPLLTTIA